MQKRNLEINLATRMDQTSEINMQHLEELYDEEQYCEQYYDQDYEQDSENQFEDHYDQDEEEEPNEDEYFTGLRRIQDDWYNGFQINQVRKEKDMAKRKTIFEKLGFQPKTS